MDNYKKIYNEFKVTLEDCKNISYNHAGIPAPTSVHYYSSLLFTKLCASSVTVLSICPKPKKIGQNAHWDCSSVAALTRGIIEAYLVFYYLCIDKCDSIEWEARWRLLNLHDHMSRLKLFKTANDEETIEQFNQYTDQVKADLEQTEYFKRLNVDQKKRYLKGEKAFFKSQDELIESMHGNVSEFRFKYRFLSNHTHSYPMGFYRMAENSQGTGVESVLEISYSGMCLSWACEYLTKAKSEFLELWTVHDKSLI